MCVIGTPMSYMLDFRENYKPASLILGRFSLILSFGEQLLEVITSTTDVSTVQIQLTTDASTLQIHVPTRQQMLQQGT